MIALIPARKGSKGLPGKNKKILSGKPLIAYTIEAALKAKNVSDVYVTTDDPEIIDISKDYGAKVLEIRPTHLASDTAQAIDTYLYMIKLWEERGIDHDSFVILQPTSPLRSSNSINEAIDLFENKKADSVISYVKESHPVIWHKYINEDFTFELIFPESIENRQQHKVSYYPNGAIYVFKKVLILRRKYFSDKSFAYIMPKLESVDIDEISDFRYAEFLLNS